MPPPLSGAPPAFAILPPKPGLPAVAVVPPAMARRPLLRSFRRIPIRHRCRVPPPGGEVRVVIPGGGERRRSTPAGLLFERNDALRPEQKALQPLETPLSKPPEIAIRGRRDRSTDRQGHGKPGRLVLSPLFIDVAGARVNLVRTTEVSGTTQRPSRSHPLSKQVDVHIGKKRIRSFAFRLTCRGAGQNGCDPSALIADRSRSPLVRASILLR